MNYPEEMFPNELFDLFATKQFNELTTAEKNLVSQHMDMEEYQQFAHSVMSFTAMDQALTIQSTSLQTKKRKTRTLKSFWNYKLPLYQAAAACVLFTLAAVFLLQKVNSNHFSKTSHVAPPAPMATKVIDEQAASRHLQEIKLVVNNSKVLGKSLAEDNYPRDLIFEY